MCDVCVLLDLQAFVDVHIHFARLTAPMTRVNDRWSDDHVGTVVIRCRSRAGRISYKYKQTSWLPGFARDPPSLALPPIRPSLPRITRLRPEHLQFHRSK